MTWYYGWKRDREKTVEIEMLSPEIGAGRMSCPECEGTGWWGYGPTEAECGLCVDCKGTGKILVSI